MNKLRRKEIENIRKELDNLKDRLEAVKEEEQQSLDNLPFSLQDSKAPDMENAISEIEGWAEDIKAISESIQNTII